MAKKTKAVLQVQALMSLSFAIEAEGSSAKKVQAAVKDFLKVIEEELELGIDSDAKMPLGAFVELDDFTFDEFDGYLGGVEEEE